MIERSRDSVVGVMVCEVGMIDLRNEELEESGSHLSSGKDGGL